MLARLALALLILTATAAGAEAHHVMGGTTPQTLAQGLLSGLAHPVIGLDHLAFTVAAGLLAASLPPPLARAALMPLAFLVAGAVGASLHLAGVDLPRRRDCGRALGPHARRADSVEPQAVGANARGAVCRGGAVSRPRARREHRRRRAGAARRLFRRLGRGAIRDRPHRDARRALDRRRAPGARPPGRDRR